MADIIFVLVTLWLGFYIDAKSSRLSAKKIEHQSWAEDGNKTCINEETEQGNVMKMLQ